MALRRGMLVSPPLRCVCGHTAGSGATGGPQGKGQDGGCACGRTTALGCGAAGGGEREEHRGGCICGRTAGCGCGAAGGRMAEGARRRLLLSRTAGRGWGAAGGGERRCTMARDATRRRVLAIGAVTLPLAAAGCKGLTALGTPPTAEPGVAVADDAITVEARLIARYAAVLAAVPALA